MNARPFSAFLLAWLSGGLLLPRVLLGAVQDYPGPKPGRVEFTVTDTDIILSNKVLKAAWRLGSPGLRRILVRDIQTGRELACTGEVFRVTLADGRQFGASALRPLSKPVLTEFKPDPQSARLASRLGGRQLQVPLESPDGSLLFTWRLVARDDSGYFREELEVVSPTADVTIREITWLEQQIPGARQAGRVDGSPVVAGPFYLGYEEPMAANVVGSSGQTIGTWSADDLAVGEFRRKTWPLKVSGLVPGTNEVLFRYERGSHRLDIARVVLVENGREIARDEHPGRTGIEHVDNQYGLTVARVDPEARYELGADLGTDPSLKLPDGQRVESFGQVKFLGGSGPTICRLVRKAALARGAHLRQSFVVGVTPPGQFRRGFLHYLEQERAHPYRPFLHYNSWYDIAWHPFALNETNCLEAIRLTGERFIRAHRVTVDAMVFDDGWDDPQTMWQFHRGFPQGFTPLAGLCREYGTRLGVWLSPFGGYGESKEQRLKLGRAQGYETNATGFSLAGAKYYDAFRQSCLNMIRRYGVNHFKFDGIASGMYANGSGADYILDTEAMRRLMLELRVEAPNLYINLTTGSWPSPFWLLYADSLWRQGGDMGHAGKGSTQKQWLTYRDQEVYRNVVRKSPLFPLSSLMTQGVAYSREGMAGDPSFNASGFKDDVHAFFGAGTSLQELYIQPGKLTPSDWAILAEAAKWSRSNADVLSDTHWLGGDPSRLEVYGYASWTPRKGVVMLRNPDERSHEFALDIAVAFELPPGSQARFELKSPWAEDRDKPVFSASTEEPLKLTLQPFEVLVFDAIPVAGL